MLSVYKLEHKLTLCSEFGISEGVSAASAAGMRTVVVPSISDLSAYPDPSPGNASGKSIWGEGSWATLSCMNWQTPGQFLQCKNHSSRH
jgi:hypothetical protein